MSESPPQPPEVVPTGKRPYVILWRILGVILVVAMAWFLLKEAIEPHWTIRLGDLMSPGPPPISMVLDSGLAVHVYADTRPHVGKITPLQKGLVLVQDGQELIEEGYEDLREVPAERMTTDLLERVHRATVTGSAELDPEAAQAIDALPWPRYYLDFETVGFPVPIWAGTRPFQALPFQWSCHGEGTDGEIHHREFLDTSGEPPMRAFAESLIATLGSEGPILVYSAYEKRILNELASAYSDLAPALQALVARLVDLQPITRRHYYHPAMKGRWSIKAVLPTVAPDLDYASLGEVQDGTAAQAAYAELIDPATDAARKQELEHALREYCKLDTLAMVRLARFLASSKDQL